MSVKDKDVFGIFRDVVPKKCRVRAPHSWNIFLVIPLSRTLNHNSPNGNKKARRFAGILKMLLALFTPYPTPLVLRVSKDS